MGLFGGLGKIIKKVAPKVIPFGEVAGGVFDALQGAKKQSADLRSQAAQDAINQATLDLQKSRLGEDTRQFDVSQAQRQREFADTFGLDQDRFAKDKETEQFGRARNARFAKVRAPFVPGLLAGRNLAQDPAATERLARIGGG